MCKIIFRLIKQLFIGFLSVCTIGSFGESLVSGSKEPIKCLTLNNLPCQARSILININSDKTLFYPVLSGFNKCSGS